MRRPTIVKESGPYRVTSNSDGTLNVDPTWSQFLPWNREEGGGPGLVSRLTLAEMLGRWLNTPYDKK